MINKQELKQELLEEIKNAPVIFIEDTESAIDKIIEEEKNV